MLDIFCKLSRPDRRQVGNSRQNVVDTNPKVSVPNAGGTLEQRSPHLSSPAIYTPTQTPKTVENPDQMTAKPLQQ